MKKVGLVVMVVACLVAGCQHSPQSSEYRLRLYHQERQRRLFYMTDYQKLYDACIKVIKNRRSYKRVEWVESDGEPYEAKNIELIYIEPKDPNLPEPILKLDPTTIVATNSRLAIHFHHGPPVCSHLGVVAFLDENKIEDTNGPPEELEMLVGTFDQENRLLEPNNNSWIKIIDNLWYFDTDNIRSDCADKNRKKYIKIFRKQLAEQNERRSWKKATEKKQ